MTATGYPGGSLKAHLQEIKKLWLEGNSAQEIFESNPNKFKAKGTVAHALNSMKKGLAPLKISALEIKNRITQQVADNKKVKDAYDTLVKDYKKRGLKIKPSQASLIRETNLGSSVVSRVIKAENLNVEPRSLSPEVQEAQLKKTQEALEKNRLRLKELKPVYKGRGSKFGETPKVVDLAGPEKLKKEYLTELKKRLKYPAAGAEYRAAVARGEILSNPQLAKRFKLGDVSTAERINSYFIKKENLKYTPQTYEGKKEIQRLRDIKRKGYIDVASSRSNEKLIQDLIKKIDPTALKYDIDVAHRASLRANAIFGGNYLINSLGIDPKEVNSRIVKPAEIKLGGLYDAQKKLIKGLTPGKFPKDIQKRLEQLNYTISRVSGETDGALQGVLMNEKTGRVGHIYGINYNKVLGKGFVDGLVKDLTPAKLDLIALNLPKDIQEGRGVQTALLDIFNNKTTTTPQKNQIAIALQCIGKAEGGRIGYALGSATINCVNTKLTNEPVQSSMRLRIAEGVGKIKPAATNFLKLLGKGGARAAPFAALAAVGAGIEPLVKPFVIDDPSTYLTDESQMKGMLLATIEGETPKVDEEILKWQLPALGAATAAGAIPGAREAYLDRLTGRGPAVGPAGTKALATIPEKPVGKARAALGIKGVLGKALGATFSPLAVAATTPLHIAAQRKEGTEWGDIATDPSHWFGPAFASSGYQMASKGITNPTLLKALRLGISPSVLRTVSSRFGLPGLMISGGMWGYDKWKNRSVNDPED